MMNTFKLTVASPDGTIFQGDVMKVSLRGADGDLAVMAGHIPFITPIQAGGCYITLPDGTQKAATAAGGLLTVSPSDVTILSDSFQWA